MKVGDLEELKQRILGRGVLSDDEISKRLESAKKEIAQAGDCDYEVENKFGEFKKCVSTVEKIVLDEIKDLY